MVTELDEKDFIQEPKQRKLLWLFLVLLLLAGGLMWMIGKWQVAILEHERQSSPFLQVTNREFSLFLWQNPRLMRAHMGKRLGYLPHFSSEDDVRVLPAYADTYVSAPPEILFRYHTWHRLLGEASVAPRPISQAEFQEFLQANPEWLPENWPDAPADYQQSVDSEDLEEALPDEVRLAFQGWKNYFLEWDEIEAIEPTEARMEAFLQEHATYRRSYWRNLIPDYLQSLPQEEALAPFLKIGFFNFTMH